MESTHFWYSIYKRKKGWTWVVVALFQNEDTTAIKEIRRGWAPIKFFANFFGQNAVFRIYEKLREDNLIE